MAAGEVVWVGLEPLGERDGRVALYLADHLSAAPAARHRRPIRRRKHSRASSRRVSWRSSSICSRAARRSSAPLHEAGGGGYPAETVDAMWKLVWRGLVTNDTFHAVRALHAKRAPVRGGGRAGSMHRRFDRGAWFRLRPRGAGRSCDRRAPASRRATQDGQDGAAWTRTDHVWATATAQQLLARHGVLTREAVDGGIDRRRIRRVYPVLKAMEENGRLRRGYFVAGLGATQFALPGAVDLLRTLRDAPEDPEVVVLAATDPANPYGASLQVSTAGRSRTLAAADAS